jgi:Leucine-rich repeat (LRR) protein
MVLNLSKNSIENIAPLKNLNKLRILDLSENCIPNIDALSGCVELVNINLEGNMLKGIDQLRSLKTCVLLRNLHLQTLGGNNENPICSLGNYRANVCS